MQIVEVRSWEIGKFTVRQRPRFDNPSWGQYLVFIGEKLIGKSFSMPDLGACEWLERQEAGRTIYAYNSAPLPDTSMYRRGVSKPRMPITLKIKTGKRGRPSNAQRAAALAAAMAEEETT